MPTHRPVASVLPGELVKNAGILMPEVCRETQEPVLLKAAQADLDAQPGLGSHAVATQSSGTPGTWAAVLGAEQACYVTSLGLPQASVLRVREDEGCELLSLVEPPHMEGVIVRIAASILSV